MLLVLALPLAGCADGETENGDGLSALTAASQVTDLASRLVPIAETVATDPSIANRRNAAAGLAELSQEATSLSEEIGAKLDAGAGRPVAAVSLCLGQAFRLMEEAVSAQRGGEAQRIARRGRVRLEGCLGNLRKAIERLGMRGEGESLVARVSSQAEAVDRLLARVVGAMRAPSEGQGVAAGAGAPEPPAPPATPPAPESGSASPPPAPSAPSSSSPSTSPSSGTDSGGNGSFGAIGERD